MSTPTLQFVTQMKLRELHRQRARLREAYERIDRRVADAATPAERVRLLYDGLRSVKFANRRLHSDVVNLDILLHELESGAQAPSVATLWEERLRSEVAAGYLRSEFVFLFGALLEEWARDTRADTRRAAEAEQERQRMREAILTAPTDNRHRQILEPLFDAFYESLTLLSSRLAEATRQAMSDTISGPELGVSLDRLAKTIYHTPRLRREARQFHANQESQKELADALTILTADLPTWDWPAEGMEVRALWTRNRWRLYPDVDLPTACFLEVVGRRWAFAVAEKVGRANDAPLRRARLQKLMDLNAPDVITENERRMLRMAEESKGWGLLQSPDLCAPDETGEETTGSVALLRSEHQQSLRSFSATDDYDDNYGGQVTRVVSLVNAEMRLARAAFPERPLHVVKVDLRDYFASIPHDLLDTLLQRLGLADSDLDFFRRFLTPPLRSADGTPVRARRGVLMNHTLSFTLAELVLRLLEAHIGRHTRVRIVRLVDDIALLTPDAAAVLEAWRRIEEFCEACGLGINLAKCGAVCLGGSLPEGLPLGPPRWGMVELTEAGTWGIHEPTLQAHLDQTRAQVEAAVSVLSRAQQYNANVQFLTGALALSAPLDDIHRAAAGQAVRRFHHDFFGPGRGVVADLCVTLRERFGAGVTDIPEAWVYWPVTAGGLGLHNPLVIAGQYARAYRKKTREKVPTERPRHWETADDAWGQFYAQFLEPLEPAKPRETKVMKTLVDDFILRGSEISSGRQEGLSSYWRWVLYTYGPQILQRFGTFRFLLTELVPLQLISGRRVQETSLDQGEATDGGQEGAF